MRYKGGTSKHLFLSLKSKDVVFVVAPEKLDAFKTKLALNNQSYQAAIKTTTERFYRQEHMSLLDDVSGYRFVNR